MQSLVKESIFTFFIRLLIMAIVLSTNIILSRVLGPSAKGSFDLYLLVLTIASLLVIPSIGASNVYYGARAPAKIPLLYTNSIVAAILFALLSIALIETIFFLPSIKLYFYKNNVELFWLHILLLFLPVLLIKNFLAEIIRAVGNIRRYNYIFLGEKIIFFAAIVFLLGISNLTLRWTLCVWLLSMLAASIVVILFTKSYTKNKYSLDIPQLRKSLLFSLRLHPGTVAQFLNYRADVFLIGMFLGPYEIGLYMTATMLGEKLWEIPHSIRTVLMFQAASDGRYKTMNAMLQLSRILMFLLGLLCIILALFAYPLVGFLFGNTFLPSAKPLILLMPGVWALGVGKLYTSYLTGIGFPEVGTYSALVSLLVTIILDLLLIPTSGIAGAAAASSIAYILAFIVILAAFKKETNAKLTKMLFLRFEDLRAFHIYIRKFQTNYVP